MRWLKSTSQKTWYALGYKIPACVTPNHDYLQLGEEEYGKISKLPVIASLIKAGGILVLNDEPAELKNSVEVLQGSNAELIAKNTALEEELKQLRAAQQPEAVNVEAIKEEAVAELKAEAVAELQAKEDEIADLKKQLAAAKKAAKDK